MSDFHEALERYLFEALMRSGRSVVERDFSSVLMWDENGEFRDDDEVEKIVRELERASLEHVRLIIDQLKEKGFTDETDFAESKELLKSIIEENLAKFESDLRGRGY